MHFRKKEQLKKTWLDVIQLLISQAENVNIHQNKNMQSQLPD